jgi:hypothetical protein
MQDISYEETLEVYREQLKESEEEIGKGRGEESKLQVLSLGALPCKPQATKRPCYY